MILTSVDKFHINGRGDVYTFNGPVTYGEIKEYLGKEVTIDGKQFIIRGIESFPTWNRDERTDFGLLVDEA